MAGETSGKQRSSVCVFVSLYALCTTVKSLNHQEFSSFDGWVVCASALHVQSLADTRAWCPNTCMHDGWVMGDVHVVLSMYTKNQDGDDV